ncbi:hypothetical protein CSUI_010462, partial [Cystoisospora suis]
MTWFAKTPSSPPTLEASTPVSTASVFETDLNSAVSSSAGVACTPYSSATAQPALALRGGLRLSQPSPACAAEGELEGRLDDGTALPSSGVSVSSLQWRRGGVSSSRGVS